MVKFLIRLVLCGFGIAGLVDHTRGDEPLRLGTSVWPGYEPLHLANRLGMLDESKVNLVAYRSATQVMQALQSKAIDAGALTLDEVVTLTCGGVPLTIVMVVDFSSGGDSIVGQAGIARMADLRGKRVAVESTALGAFMLLRALEKSGLSEQDVIPVRMEVSRHTEAFKAGEISASVCFEPTRSALVALGGNELFTSAEIPGEIVDVIAIRTDLLPARRQALRHLGAAWDKALRTIGENPDESYKILGERMRQSPSEARASYAGLTLYTREASSKLLAGTSFQDGALPRLIDFMADRGLVKQRIAPSIDVNAVAEMGKR